MSSPHGVIGCALTAAIRSAFAAGVECAGLDIANRRPWIGCDPSDEAASKAYRELVKLAKAFPRQFDAALWRYVTQRNSAQESPAEIQQAFGTTYSEH